jgi:signal transduction histidine kinase
LVSVAREVQQVVFFGSVAIAFSGLESAVVKGSKFELMRVFQNVFKNSLEAGATQLTVAMARAGDRVEMIVTDNGAGMDADRMRRALKGGFTSKENGTGLGLSICRHLLGTHGATMTLESTPGKGSVVRMVFPSAA